MIEGIHDDHRGAWRGLFRFGSSSDGCSKKMIEQGGGIGFSRLLRQTSGLIDLDLDLLLQDLELLGRGNAVFQQQMGQAFKGIRSLRFLKILRGAVFALVIRG